MYRMPEKEAQRGHMIDIRADGEFSFVQQMRLPLPTVIDAEPIRTINYKRADEPSGPPC